jgi:hypothetical protein
MMRKRDLDEELAWLAEVALFAGSSVSMQPAKGIGRPIFSQRPHETGRS